MCYRFYYPATDTDSHMIVPSSEDTGEFIFTSGSGWMLLCKEFIVVEDVFST